MTIVDDMSTTRKAARYKGSRPLAKENSDYADPATMPTVGDAPADALVERVLSAAATARLSA